MISNTKKLGFAATMVAILAVASLLKTWFPYRLESLPDILGMLLADLANLGLLPPEMGGRAPYLILLYAVLVMLVCFLPKAEKPLLPAFGGTAGEPGDEDETRMHEVFRSFYLVQSGIIAFCASVALVLVSGWIAPARYTLWAAPLCFIVVMRLFTIEFIEDMQIGRIYLAPAPLRLGLMIFSTLLLLIFGVVFLSVAVAILGAVLAAGGQ